MRFLKFLFIICVICSAGIANAQNNVEDSAAKMIRKALQVSGLNTTGHPLLSKNYGPFLSKLGYSVISPINYTPQIDDIRVFQPIPGGDPVGHIDMYIGDVWASDFKEHNFWPSAKYKKYHPSYQIFRWVRQ